MTSFVDGIKQSLADLRRRSGTVDHALRTQEQYSATNASQQAGAVTYFGFLSVFPVLALAFFVVGYVARVYPGAQTALISAISDMFPEMIGDGTAQLQLSDIQDSAGAVGLIGLIGVLYSGLGWLSALRSALCSVLEVPQEEQPGFVVAKLRDLITLAVVGSVLIFAVVFTGLVAGFSDRVLDFLHLGGELSWLVVAITVVVGLLANSVLFYAMFRLLADPGLPQRAMWSGALLGAVGFEVLKQVSGALIKSTQGQPAFQVFGLALILVVWINYFSRVVLYAASWAWTHSLSRARRADEPCDPVQGPQVPSLSELAQVHARPPRSRAKPFVVGAVLGAVATVAAVGRGKGGV